MFTKINPNFLIAGVVLLVALAALNIRRQASAPRETINTEQMQAPPEAPGMRSGKQP